MTGHEGRTPAEGAVDTAGPEGRVGRRGSARAGSRAARARRCLPPSGEELLGYLPESDTVGEGCNGLFLATEAGAVVLRRAGGALLCRGPFPPCAACTFLVERTEDVPLVWAVAPSPLSAAPQEVYLGLCDPDATLIWIDAWAGAGPEDPAYHRPAGPPFSLAPTACPEGWDLRLVPRFPAEGAAPTSAQRAAAGRFRDGAGAGAAGPPKQGACGPTVAVPP